ncbi:MAG: hypothetical protein H6824_10095 [Planctomycetaceae bacterium]|nr:hypothetical protein [Planctomycetaceae bacterium]
MTSLCPYIHPIRRLVCVLVLVAAAAGVIQADELHLDNGMVLQGIVVKVPGLKMLTAERNNISEIRNLPFYMVDDGVRRYFLSTRFATPVDYDPLNPYVTYDLFQQKTGRAPGPGVVGASKATPFDRFGRRTVSLTSKHGDIHIIQGITKVRPDWVLVEGLNHDWEYRLDTKVVPDEVLQAIVEQATDQQNSEERKHAVMFFLQADKPRLAQQELERLGEDFPELAEWCRAYKQSIAELSARLGLNELKLRRLSGQHQLANFIARQVPVDEVSADVALEAQEIVATYDKALEDRDRALMWLDLLHAKIPEETAAELQGMRARLRDEMHVETLERLVPFLRVVEDETLTPDQKLALAYSGWVLGAPEAVEELKVAQNLWAARFLVLEYIRSDNDLRRDEILEELQNLEGVSVSRVAEMVGQLPMAFETPVTESSVVEEVTFSSDSGDAERQYSLMLPPEYSPHLAYPMLVVLSSGGQDEVSAVKWWAGDAQQQGWAQRRGYIVIAPHYLDKETGEYDYSTESNALVRDCITHVRKRYRVDSDRVFIAGHGMGADATYDVALSAPDLFAGAITIAGKIERHALFLWENGHQLAWYVVGGERDRDTTEHNATSLNRMLVKRQDMIYCDYKSRGYEGYGEEQERIFEWMQTKRRKSLAEVADFDVGSLRMSDNQFHWLAAHSMPPQLFPPLPANGRATGVSVRPFKAHVAVGGPIYLQHPGKSTTFWLSPEFISFEDRHRISINGRVVFNSFISPSMEDLLEDLRIRGDRERLFWAKMTF